MPGKEEWVELGHVAVDSGQLMIADPCYVMTQGEYDKISFRDEYDERGSRTTPDGEYVVTGTGGTAVKFDPGFGDGTYQVLARYEDHGSWGRRCAEVRIVCIQEEDDDDLENGLDGDEDW